MSGNPRTPEAPIPAIADAVLAACYADARSCYPSESCGLLSGPRDQPLIDEALPCVNQQDRLHQADPQTHPRTARSAYSLGFRDLQRLDSSLSGDRPVKVIYHSHVDLAAYFSPEDERAATFEGELVYPVDYLVIDCQSDGIRGAKLFRFRDGAFVQIQEYPPA